MSTAGAHSTTATSDDDVTHYHAYTQTSDSDQRSSKFKLTGLTRSRRNNGRGPAHRKAGRSFDPSAKDVLEGGAGFRPPYQSSSDLSSPNNETCYSFVRRAIERMSTPVHRRYDEQDDSEGGSSSTMETRFPWLGLAKLEKFSIHSVNIL